MPADALISELIPRPEWLPPDVWPWPINSLIVDRSWVAVSEIGRGPTLLFYTGIGFYVWRDVIARLKDEFHCVTLDPPGIGASASIPPSDATLARSARAVTAAIEALELSDITVVAHDTGGPPAFAVAARHPRRIRGLVAVNTFGWRPAGSAFRAMLAVMGNPAMRQFSLATGALARVTATTFGTGRHLDERSRDAFRAGFQKSMNVFHDYLRDARDSDLYGQLSTAFMGPLRHVPAMTIFGERNDPLRFQPTWKAIFPKVRQVVVPKGNHFPMCDDPDLVANEIRRFAMERRR
ncbi:MAG TPA: alpha/beta hydrolase [Vicinamibacterales bacterium]|nr:alpha/beta hydrolase [Vicinamibacterales bacterium]